MTPDITIVRTREKVTDDPRRLFTTKQRAQLFARSKGSCDLCREKIRGRWIAGHVIAHSMGGRTILQNGRVECLKCAGTTHIKDTMTAAKARRIIGLTGPVKRRKERGASMRSRGFDKTMRKRFDGTVERRGQ